MAHGWFGRVLAVWDAGIVAPPPGTVRRRTADAVPGLTGEGLVSPLAKLARGVTRVVPSPEAGLFLLLFLAMVGFAVDWALRILGLR